MAAGYVYATGEAAATSVMATSAAGAAALNSKIEENETLANMKKNAAEGANQAATYMSSLFGWKNEAAAANAPQAAQQPEEVKMEDAG